MLDALELAQIQADTASVLDLPAIIQRSTNVDETQGGKTQTWNTISPNGLMAGMAPPTAGQLQNYGYLVGSLATWQVKYPVGTDVLENDRTIIAGQTLNVVKLLNPRSYPALLTVLATEVK